MEVDHIPLKFLREDYEHVKKKKLWSLSSAQL